MQEVNLGLEAVAKKIIKLSNCENLIMKTGPEGFIVYERTNNNEFIRQLFPALVVNPVDVTGAGDSLLAAMSVGLSAQQSFMVTAALGCCMASLAVERMGNMTVKASEIVERIEAIYSKEEKFN